MYITVRGMNKYINEFEKWVAELEHNGMLMNDVMKHTFLLWGITNPNYATMIDLCSRVSYLHAIMDLCAKAALLKKDFGPKSRQFNNTTHTDNSSNPMHAKVKLHPDSLECIPKEAWDKMMKGN